MKRRKGTPKVDLASRSTSQKRDLTGEFLEGTESSLTTIEPTGAASFEEAWNNTTENRNAQNLDDALDVGQDDSEVRNLDKSRWGTLAGWVVVAVGIGAIIFFVFDRTQEPEADLGARASSNADSNVLSSPLQERDYTSVAGAVVVTVSAPLPNHFIDPSGSGEVESTTDENGIAGRYLFGPVFWAGRTHVAVISDQSLLATSQECVISSLVTADLRAVDVATVGACDAAFGTTGDRVACRGESVVLLEVWPFNPDSATEPETATMIRTRVEQRTGQSVTSLRGSLDLSTAEGVSPIVASAETLNGSPGDVVTIELDGLTGTCELLDRSAVDVRLLPN